MICKRDFGILVRPDLPFWWPKSLTQVILVLPVRKETVSNKVLYWLKSMTTNYRHRDRLRWLNLLRLIFELKNHRLKN